MSTARFASSVGRLEDSSTSSNPTNVTSPRPRFIVEQLMEAVNQQLEEAKTNETAGRGRPGMRNNLDVRRCLELLEAVRRPMNALSIGSKRAEQLKTEQTRLLLEVSILAVGRQLDRVNAFIEAQLPSGVSGRRKLSLCEENIWKLRSMSRKLSMATKARWALQPDHAYQVTHQDEQQGMEEDDAQHQQCEDEAEGLTWATLGVQDQGRTMEELRELLMVAVVDLVKLFKLKNTRFDGTSFQDVVSTLQIIAGLPKLVILTKAKKNNNSNRARVAQLAQTLSMTGWNLLSTIRVAETVKEVQSSESAKRQTLQILDHVISMTSKNTLALESLADEMVDLKGNIRKAVQEVLRVSKSGNDDHDIRALKSVFARHMHPSELSARLDALRTELDSLRKEAIALKPAYHRLMHRLNNRRTCGVDYSEIYQVRVHMLQATRDIREQGLLSQDITGAMQQLQEAVKALCALAPAEAHASDRTAPAALPSFQIRNSLCVLESQQSGLGQGGDEVSTVQTMRRIDTLRSAVDLGQSLMQTRTTTPPSRDQIVASANRILMALNAVMSDLRKPTVRASYHLLATRAATQTQRARQELCRTLAKLHSMLPAPMWQQLMQVEPEIAAFWGTPAAQQQQQQSQRRRLSNRSSLVTALRKKIKK